MNEDGRVTLRRLDAAEAEAALPALGAILVDAVANGASVNFLAGFAQAEGEAFWRGQLPLIAEGKRILIVATRDGAIAGTVVITFAPQPNQPHRADVGKMLVHSAARRQGIGRALLEAAETAALDAGKTLLVLDTETDSAGHRLYAACGWTEVGTIPGYALSTDGRPKGATIFYKMIGRH
ncbi:GNAT family N-acetyltransferase [Kaistia dalseonensis]|uniref:GNAT superfamily N-acetyltransferase n=1 Tax=Kaistia dalseonensis TaxID=410840 RepID=A0ABU0H9T7_9HYPH|nr:GNAT family N-acetyltransferase [Kaistia dalseonensis]MCX5496465.1 GNAT family N-acetyltransferase [Kaistia dalseonensis]MDQ0439087.1 GNAT superfamily N-acetyltransferase [Kaistia dalseonensis]